jgi:hypothetical protein
MSFYVQHDKTLRGKVVEESYNDKNKMSLIVIEFEN